MKTYLLKIKDEKMWQDFKVAAVKNDYNIRQALEKAMDVFIRNNPKSKEKGEGK
jgi:hypothetical protein